MTKTNDTTLIIGAGFAGLAMAYKMKMAGIHDFVVLEQAEEVGGTWRDNTYPGCACDVPSHLYSFSFAPNPSWSRMFAPQPEILAYLKRFVEENHLRRYIQFGTRVTGASYDESTGMWEVHSEGGKVYHARTVIAGMGPLNRATLPEIPGREEFRGVTFHSSAWNHDYDLTGKRVAVIGTGASAIQLVPAIAPRVGKLSLFQRTPPWIIPKPDFEISAGAQRRLGRSKLLQHAAHDVLYWLLELRGVGWIVDPRLQGWVKRTALKHLRASVADAELRARLTPSYTIGCKRILLSNDYYPALQRPNLELITEALQEIRADRLVTRDGREHEVDAIIYGTGFQVADFIVPFEIRGRGGLELNQVFRQRGVEAYLGTSVAGFPNLFFLLGPNTGLGHSSMVFMIESQARYVLDALHTLREKRLKSVEVKRSQQDHFNQQLQQRMGHTVWATGCKSWYLSKDGKNPTVWPGFTFEYRLRTRRFDTASYELEPKPARATVAPSSEPGFIATA